MSCQYQILSTQRGKILVYPFVHIFTDSTPFRCPLIHLLILLQFLSLTSSHILEPLHYSCCHHPLIPRPPPAPLRNKCSTHHILLGELPSTLVSFHPPTSSSLTHPNSALKGTPSIIAGTDTTVTNLLDFDDDNQNNHSNSNNNGVHPPLSIVDNMTTHESSSSHHLLSEGHVEVYGLPIPEVELHSLELLQSHNGEQLYSPYPYPSPPVFSSFLFRTPPPPLHTSSVVPSPLLYSSTLLSSLPPTGISQDHTSHSDPPSHAISPISNSHFTLTLTIKPLVI